MNRRKFLARGGVAAASAAAVTQAVAQIAVAAAASAGAAPRASRRASTPSTAAPSCIAKRVSELTGGKFQIRVFAAGEIVPGVRRGRRDPAGHGRVRAHRELLLRRQEQDLRVRHDDALRPEPAPAERVDLLRRRPGPGARVLPRLRHHLVPGRQHRRADGRLVAQGSEDRRRPQGREDAHRGPGRRGDGAPGRGAAADRRRRHLSGARARRDRRGRMDRPVRRREARLLQDRAALLLSRAGGRATRCTRST